MPKKGDISVEADLDTTKPSKETKLKVEKTLTSNSGITLDRSKLHAMGDIEKPQEGSSFRVIVILVVLIIVVAVGGAMLIKNIQNSENTKQNTQEQENTNANPSPEAPKVVEPPKLTLEDKILSKNVLADDAVTNAVKKDEYTDEDKELPNKDTKSQYDLKGIKGQQYQSFYRVEFKFAPKTKSDKLSIPAVNANYRETVMEVELTFANTVEDESGILVGKFITIENSVLSSIVRSSKAKEGELVYQLKFNDLTKYSIQSEGDTLIIDFLELEPKALTTDPTVSPAVTPADTATDKDTTEEDAKDKEEEKSAEVTPTPAPSSDANKGITSDVTGNVAGIKGFTYDDTVEKFIYKLRLSNNYLPNVTSSASTSGENYIVSVKIQNLAMDGVAKPPYNSQIFDRVKNVLGAEASFANNTSTYNFTLGEKGDYEIEYDKAENTILISFLH